jgi:hypothetical protein
VSAIFGDENFEIVEFEFFEIFGRFSAVALGSDKTVVGD